MLATMGLEWQRKWRDEGLAAGHAAGQAAILLRQMGRRFGPLSDAVRQQILSASPEQLDHWADAILDAKTLNEVLYPG